MNKTDYFYMQRALFLAQKGRFSVSPNPRVGAVIVHDNKIIGEGYHRQYGEAHAEVNAINCVKDKTLLKKASIYVTLEPCSHYGNTPPCADLILQHNIPRVVIANKDPFEKVNGSGIERLSAKGVEVISGVLKEEAAKINRRFFTFHQKKRPYIILKWAETADGFIGRSSDDPNKADSWITSAASKQLVHLWRAEEDGILVGKNTALIDNPTLSTREVVGKNPSRILIDRNLEVANDFKILNDEATTFIFNAIKNEKKQLLNYFKIDFSSNEKVLVDILSELHHQNIQSIIVEGGSETLQSFIDLKLWDEARVFSAEKKFYKGIKAPDFRGNKISTISIQKDVLSIYHPS